MATTVNPELKNFQTLLQRYVILLELLNAKQQIEYYLKKKYEQNTIYDLLQNKLDIKNFIQKETDEDKYKGSNTVHIDILNAFFGEESTKKIYSINSNFPGLSIEKDLLKFENLQGAGHTGAGVQKYIEGVDTYTPWGKIFLSLSVSSQTASNPTATFLHWEFTNNNIIAKWDQDEKGKGEKDEEKSRFLTEIKSKPYKELKEIIADISKLSIPHKIKELEFKLPSKTSIGKIEINYIFKEITDTTIQEHIKEFYNAYNKHSTSLQILLDRYNIVYTGAPGTGKTYLAKEMAAQLVAGLSYSELDPKVRDEQIAFVQFHPSYDYSNFVEGLHSYERGDNQIGFRREDGIFKEFCKKAYKEWDAVKKLVDKLTDSNIKNNKELQIEDGQFSRTATANIPDQEDGEEDEHYKNRIKYIATRALANKYVFIIDEINRGELSKIFGELFYSIDPGYRGENGRVKTQYQKLVKYELNDEGNPMEDVVDAFKEGFFVPENVYIIGTMNEIDRSVEPMDFAVRRRFTWIDVKPEDRMGMWGNKDWRDDAKCAMNNLNAAIRAIDLLGEDYCIGPAYFINPPTDTDNNKKIDKDTLWNLRIKTILKEYFRGLPAETVKDYLDTLEKAFKSDKDLSKGFNDYNQIKSELNKNSK